MSRLTVILVPSLLVSVMLAFGSQAQPQGASGVDARLVALESQMVPIGGVILWWGSESDEPQGFESCDGKFPITPGAMLKEKKPDLRDRFVKGPRDFSAFRPINAKTGGANTRADTFTEPHVLTLNEIPKHTHPIGHTHTLPSHLHRIGAHEHGIGEFVTHMFATGSGETLTFLQQHAAPAPSKTEAAPAGEMTGPSDVLTTSDPSQPNSGQNAWTTGTLQGHTHMIHGGDTMPAFLEMIWIIRVK